MKESKDSTLDWSKSFMYSMHETYFLVEKRLTQKLQEMKQISFSQFLVLIPLNCEKATSQSEIASFLHLTEATVSRHITSLIKKGFLVKKQVQGNRRKHQLSLTEKGREAFMGAHEVIEAELGGIFSVVPEQNRTVISTAFDHVLTQLLHTATP